MRNRQRIGAIILALFSLFFFWGCGSTELTIKSVEIDPEVNLTDIDISDFELSDLVLIVTFSNDTTKEITVTSSMLSSVDLTKLSYMGEHAIKITYEGIDVNITLILKDGVSLNNLQTYYQYAVSTLGFAGTYEAWVDSFTVGTTKTIIKAEFNNQNQLILTFSDMQTLNVGTMSSTIYTVSFYDFYGNLINTQTIPAGGNAIPPNAPTITDYTFAGWSDPFDNIQGNLEIHALYNPSGTPISSIDDADELIISLTRLQEAQFGVNLDAIFSTASSTQSVRRSRSLTSIYGESVIFDTSDGFDPEDFIPHNYWNTFFYHEGLYQQPQVIDGYQVITSTLSSFSDHALNNLYQVNTEVTDSARKRADWAVDNITVMDTWVNFGEYLNLLHYDETLDRVELYTIWESELAGAISYEKIYVYYNEKGEEVVESWVEQNLDDKDTYPGAIGYYNAIAGRDFNFYVCYLDHNYEPTDNLMFRGINLNEDGIYEYYDNSTSMISGDYGWYTVYPGIDSEREIIYYPDKPIVTVYSPDASTNVFEITPMFEGGYNVEVYLPSMYGVEALLVEDGGIVSVNQDTALTQAMFIEQGFTPMPNWWKYDASIPDISVGFKTSKGTYYAEQDNLEQDVRFNRLEIEIASEGLRAYDNYFNYFGIITLYVDAMSIEEMVSMLTTYFETIGLTYKYGSTENLFIEVGHIFENYETIGRSLSVINDIADFDTETYLSYENYTATRSFITSYIQVRNELLGMQEEFDVIDQFDLPSKDDLNKVTLINTGLNTSGTLSATEKEISTSGITATLKRSPLLQSGESYSLYYALQIGGRLIPLAHEDAKVFTNQDLTFTGSKTFVIPENLEVGAYELVTFFGKVVLDTYLRISNPIALSITGLDSYHVTTLDPTYDMATDTHVYTESGILKVFVQNIDLHAPKVTISDDVEDYQNEVILDELMIPIGSTVEDLLSLLVVIDNFDGLMAPDVSIITKDDLPVALTDLLTETGWKISVSDLAGNETIITLTKISFGYTVTFMWDEEVLDEMIIPSGETVTPTTPVKPGYTFTNWDSDNFVITEDRIIKAIYTVNSYTITWMYQDQVHQTDTNLLFGSFILMPVMPDQLGHFFRWNIDTQTVPAQDLIVTGEYVKHEFNILYYIDGYFYGSQTYHYGDMITYLVPNLPDGLVFSGWDISVEIMPADHLEARGTTTPANPS